MRQARHIQSARNGLKDFWRDGSWRRHPRDWLNFILVVNHNLFRSAPFEITHFTLFSSYLSHSGAIYTPERSYELASRLYSKVS